MAVISDTDHSIGHIGLRFHSTDKNESQAILEDLRVTLLERMEFHGFHPDGVLVNTDVWP